MCGAPLPDGGKPKDATKKQPPGREGKPNEPIGEAQGSADEDDIYTLPRASEMASVKKRPPSTAATVLASVALRSSPTYAEVAGSPPPAAAPSLSPQPAADPPTHTSETDVLSGAMLGKVKSLVAELPATADERQVLAKLLEKHVAAEARLKRQEAEAKSDAADFTGMTYECILAHHETKLAAVKKRAAENSAKRETEQDNRRKELEKDRAKLQKAVDTALKELEEFNELAAVRSAEWEAAERAKASDLQAQVERATEEVNRAKAALQAAPAPNTKLGQSGTSETGKGTESVTAKGMDGFMKGKGDGMVMADGRSPTTPKLFTPMITPPPPPKLQPPSDPAALGRLQRAQAVHQLWSVQQEEWPLTPSMLGLTTQELAQLVGDVIWTRTPLVSDQASIPKSLAGFIAMALNGLEVSAAAQAAAQGAARQIMEAQQTAAGAQRASAEQDEVQAPPNKHARTGSDAGGGSDVEM